ncbi:hypothetical protein [Candidatus Liberibacter solanacearum]|uniref:Lipoprotein n=1 Tax=Candidatus Liberibacter solanacearum TaxID=556287 RepID=A0A1V2N9E9_9HYPH|nr:hypothetical protein [Candidatus Liberibacter solanacearum]ONI58578.1 hypothetical protein AYJ09_05370 [Candidatus Liberibacter solanacearum]ONI60190.1 hypothetical protein AYO25_01230 [Candidatus Liberibacter solanacearum]
MSIKKFSTFSIITTSLLGGCDLFESQSQKELKKTVEQNKQNHSNTYKPVIKEELTSDNNPITVPSIPQTSEDSSNNNESITAENSNNPEDIIENKNEADRQLDDARYRVLKLESEINNGKETNENIEKLTSLKAEYAELYQKKIKAYQEFYDFKNNPNNSTEVNNRFDFISSSDQDIQDAASFFNRDNDLEKNALVLKEMQENMGIEWKNKYDKFLNEHMQKKNKYKNITPDQKMYILQKNEEILEKS